MLVSLGAVLLTCRLVAAAYPLYTGKGRYSRSLAAWPPMPLYYPPRSTRPLYYPDTDYYYPQEPYYYPVDKYVYQSIVPGYYLDQQRPYYYGYDEVTEPVDDLQEEGMTEEYSRGETLPYGQETWFQDTSSGTADTNADVNARFLQNLILAQMYSDANKNYPTYPVKEEEENDRWVYGQTVKTSKPKVMAKEDEDVRELKSLVRGPERMERSDKKSRKEKDIFAAQTRPNNWDEFRSSYKRSSELKLTNRKAIGTTGTTPAPAPEPELTPRPLRGMKEVVLPRPASPPRTPDFHAYVSSRREPSVYDTIKKLLHMEEQLDEDESGNRLQKRSYIPSEESLVAQLGGLKKMA